MAAIALPDVLPRVFNTVLLSVGIAFVWRCPRLRIPAAFLIGLGWTGLHLGAAMQARLPHALEGDDVQIEGRVVGLPRTDADGVRFEFVVDRADEDATALEGRLLRLGWYRTALSIEPGSRWNLVARLKRPRGVVNPGGFDAERQSLERGVAATGYVRESPTNRALSAAQGIDALRADLSHAIARAVDAPSARFVQALAVGDTRALDEADWTVLRATGIAHLIAISGLHVGLVAGFGALLVRLLYRGIAGLGQRMPLPQAAAVAALLAAAGYTALAGFALPTVRTLLMIAAALAAVLLRRAFSPAQSLALALTAIVLFDPLAVLNAGFWLSFLGVAWLLWCLPQGWSMSPLRALLSAQGVSTLGLLPLTVWFFGQASIAGPFANLIAVPWVSFVVVPLALMGTAAELCAIDAGAPLFWLAATLMQWLWSLLEPLAGVRGSLAYLPEASVSAFILAWIGTAWLLLPRGVPGKPLALLLLLPLLWPARVLPSRGEAEIVLLDVGQGLSLLVRTQRHTLLYDAGPAYPGGLDLGDAAVVPALRGLGVSTLDRIVLSHGDNDHAGGIPAVIDAYPSTPVAAQRRTLHEGESLCLAGDGWTWDGVRFDILHPPDRFPYLGNDSSCVLRIETADGSVALLPGDISDAVELRLLRDHRVALDADLLIAPHHGSATSSSSAFLRAVSPQLILLGTGHRNRFGLPAEHIVARYERRDARILDTASAGAIHVRLGAGGAHVQEARRIDRPRAWRER